MPRSKGSLITLLVPVTLAGVALVLQGLPADARAWIDALGRLTGVAGLACVLLAAVLSVRIPGLDVAFGGLTDLWQLHHRLGLASFVLLLAHAPLLALAAWAHGKAALGQVLLPTGADWALQAGWVALLAMMIFLAPSFQLFGRPRYQRWKALHFLAGVALLGGLLHAVALTRVFPTPWAALIWGGLGGLALAVFVWRATLARPLMRRDYRITGRETLAERVVELSLEPADGRKLRFRPGQFVYLTPLDGQLESGRGEEHPYTLSSAPEEGELRIAIKDLGDASHALQRVPVPGRARVEGPYGDFLPARLDQEPQLWIGGGIGLTPFVSAARGMAKGRAWGPVELLYCANDPSRAYFLDELRAVAADCADFHVHPHYFHDRGALSSAFILEHCADAAHRHWYICGPPPLVALVQSIARQLGVPQSRIHSEGFAFL